MNVSPGVRRASAAAIFSAMTLLVASTHVNAAIIPTVPLATSANFSVLGGQTVTNTGNSVLNLDVGVYPGSSLTGFPPGVVNAPGVQQIANAVALQAQSDLTIAYDNAAGRTLDQTLPSISNVTVIGGAYAITAKGPLDLTGTLTLDGQNDPTSVFIFQTDSSLTTASGSSVSLINGALECNVFWQIGSSAVLGTGSVMVGNIMALTSISLEDSVTVHGRALARNGSVTLINDTFTAPSCDHLETPATTTTTTTTTTTPLAATTTTVAAGPTTSVPPLPQTGHSFGVGLGAAGFSIALGALAIGVARRRAPLRS